MATSKRVMRKVHCSRCANLLIVQGVMPLCVATCKLVSGPLRKVIDIKGMASAEKRNKRNNCRYFVWYSLHANKLKRVALAMAGTDLEASSLSQYSIEQERKTKYGKRKDGSNNKEREAAEECISEDQHNLESEIFGAEEEGGSADEETKAGSADEESSSDGGQEGAEGKETVEESRRSDGEEDADGGDGRSGERGPSPLEEYTESLSKKERAALIE